MQPGCIDPEVVFIDTDSAPRIIHCGESFLEEDLPVNLNLLTLQPWYWEEGSVPEFYMVRIEHIFQAGEHEGKY